MTSKPTHIPVVSRSEFTSQSLPATPVIIADGLSDWAALQRWSPEGFSSIGSDKTVRVDVSQSGSFRYQPDGSVLDPKTQYVLENVSLVEAAKWIMRDDPLGPKYYISQLIIGTHLPELLADLRFPEIGKTDASLLPRLWFGSAGTVTLLHFDQPNNMFAQVFGSKQFTLFAPEESPYLYPFPEDCKVSNQSLVDVDDPDVRQFPLYRQAKPIVTIVHAGQLLFIPAFWWHQVRSRAMSISVNQCVAPELYRCCAPNGVRTFRSWYKRNPSAIAKALGLSGQTLVSSAKAQLAASPAIAVLATAVAVDDCVRTGRGRIDQLLPDPFLRETWDSLLAAAVQGDESYEKTVCIRDVELCLESIHRHMNTADKLQLLQTACQDGST